MKQDKEQYCTVVQSHLSSIMVWPVTLRDKLHPLPDIEPLRQRNLSSAFFLSLSLLKRQLLFLPLSLLPIFPLPLPLCSPFSPSSLSLSPPYPINKYPIAMHNMVCLSVWDWLPCWSLLSTMQLRAWDLSLLQPLGEQCHHFYLNYNIGAMTRI